MAVVFVRITACHSLSLSLSPLPLSVFLPTSRITIHSFDIFSTTFFFFFLSLLFHMKNHPIRRYVTDKKFYETTEKRGMFFYSSMLRDLICRYDYFWLIRMYRLCIYLSNPIFFSAKLGYSSKNPIFQIFLFSYIFHHQEIYFPSKFLSLKVR